MRLIKMAWLLLIRRNFKSLSLILAVSAIFVLSNLATLYSMGIGERINRGIEEAFGSVDLIITPKGEKHFDATAVSHLAVELESYATAQLLLGDGIEYEIKGGLNRIYTAGIEQNNVSMSRYKLSKNLVGSQVAINKKTAQVCNVESGGVLTIHSNGLEQGVYVNEIIDDGQDIPIVVMDIDQLRLVQGGLDDSISAVAVDIGAGTYKAPYLDGIDLSMYLVQSVQSDENVVQIKGIAANLSIALQLLGIAASVLFVSLVIRIAINNNYRNIVSLRSIGYSKWMCVGIFLIQATLLVFISLVVASAISIVSYPYLGALISRALGHTPYAFDYNQNVLLILKLNGINFIIITLMLVMPIYAFANKLPKVNSQSATEKLRKINSKSTYYGLTAVVLGLFFCIAMRVLKANSLIIIVPILMINIGLIGSYSNVLAYLIKVIARRMLSRSKMGFICLRFISDNMLRNSLFSHILSLGIIVLIVSNAISTTISYNVKSNIEQGYPTDYILENYGPYEISKIEGLINELNALDAIEKAVWISSVATFNIEKINGIKKSGSIGVQMMDVEPYVSAVPQIKAIGDDEIVLCEKTAKDNGLFVGDQIEIMYFIDGGQIHKSYKVAQIAPFLPGASIWKSMISKIEINPPRGCQGLKKVLLEVKPSKQNKVTNEIQGLEAKYPGLNLSSRESAINEFKSTMSSRMVIVNTSLFFISLIGFIGIVISMQSYLSQNIADYNVLRLLSYSRGAVRNMIFLQAFSVFVMSVFEGILLGLITSGLLSFVFEEVVVVNWWTIALIMMLLIGFGSACVYPITVSLSKSNLIRNAASA